MLDLKHILAGLKDWTQFEAAAAGLGPKQQGDLFELLTKHYLRLSPVYRTELSDVWLLEEVPEKVRAALKLPEPDQGIDLIAKVKSGGYWAIQCKYRTDKKRSLSWRELATFTGLAFGVCKGITHALVAHTGERYTKVLDGFPPYTFPPKPPRMHWSTYWRLQERTASLERRGVEALEASVQKMTARSRAALAAFDDMKARIAGQRCPESGGHLTLRGRRCEDRT